MRLPLHIHRLSEWSGRVSYDLRRTPDFNEIEYRPHPLVYLPLAPLWRAAGAETAQQLATAVGRSRKQVERWKKDGVPARHADALACALGVHVLSIWPNWECLP